ncbi:MAG TPA: 50S ribosomal protein L25 [Chthonomonadaceae bacterium]|nr:50S ribosomal protein L25 [Chthonomonadaceae bacterium]
MQTKLNATPIQAHTKGELKRLRKEGFVPVSIQHRGEETLHFQEEAKPLDDFIQHHGEAGLLSLMIAPENRNQTVIVHGVQRDPLTNRLLHVTFQKVEQNEPIKVHVPLVWHGQPETVRLGTAFVQQALEAVEIRCLPKDLPEHLAVDIAHMNFGDVLRVADLPGSDKMEVLTPSDTVLVTLKSRIVHEVEEEPESEVTPEPESETEVIER